MKSRTVRQEYQAVSRAWRAWAQAYAQAQAHGLASAADLRDTLHACYDALAALELILASEDPQDGLFPDWKEP